MWAKSYHSEESYCWSREGERPGYSHWHTLTFSCFASIPYLAIFSPERLLPRCVPHQEHLAVKQGSGHKCTIPTLFTHFMLIVRTAICLHSVPRYEQSSRFQKCGYESIFLTYLESLVEDMDRKIKRGRQRLANNTAYREKVVSAGAYLYATLDSSYTSRNFQYQNA